ncbi:M15 family metallopeptidase [Salinimonas iocasae]|uniref:D-alanyl-D-alanine carboxypeptidase family protein n=1 Tax=Salinimonas iocasae TaxID=2572577 RepID=A0A5B7YEV1_9ALTE|nr:M15 family metallopeptidase [Salinimonas iocasae]QCZ93890.1 D-alanyl-D-alanine carboxypeptidase family protein [Salinimonas iocasae]
MSTAWLGIDNPWLCDAGKGHRLHADVVGPYLALQDGARSAGIDCQLVSSFRDFDRQLSIWNRKWRGELPLLGLDGTRLDHARLSDIEKLHAILTWSALPGGSRHHWGTDIDVYDKDTVVKRHCDFNLVDAEYRNDGPCAALADWLSVHAQTYGFFRPFLEWRGGVACELWHLSHQQTAATFEQSRNCSALADTLRRCDMEGKQIVIKHIETLYEQYVLNRGTS